MDKDDDQIMTLEAGEHDERRQRQHAVLAGALSVLCSSPQVLGVVASGSYARGTHDAFSDLDLVCYLRDESRSGRSEPYERVGAIAPTLCVLYLYDLHALYLFTNGVRLDLDFKPPSAIGQEWPSDVRILYDPDEVLAREAERSQPPLQPAHPEHFETGDPAFLDWFFWMVRQAYCWAKRGAQGGDRSFHKLNAAVASLQQVRTKLIQLRLWILGAEPWYLERVDPACAARLADTFPRLQPEEVLAATRRLLAEFEAIAPDYCGKAATPYPAAKVAVMWQLLAEFDALG